MPNLITTFFFVVVHKMSTLILCIQYFSNQRCILQCKTIIKQSIQNKIILCQMATVKYLTHVNKKNIKQSDLNNLILCQIATVKHA